MSLAERASSRGGKARAEKGDEARAQKQLAQRLIVRVRRAAHALMGGSADADDAAQHALIEILRSAYVYDAGSSIEEWADQVTARSVVRFARAVRARAGLGAQPDAAPSDERPTTRARSIEEFLRRLPSVTREALLLREVFKFDLAETAQLLLVSRRSVREHLARAREGLYARAGGEETEGLVFALPDEIARWSALRDQEPSEGAGDDAQHELVEALEADPEVGLLLKELRDLGQFLESGRLGRLTGRDRKLMEGALSAVRLSSSAGASTVSNDTSTEAPDDAEASSWVEVSSTSLCVLLVLGAFAALALRSPGTSATAADAAAPLPSAPRAPTVEALSIARAAERGAPLERSGTKLVQGTSMHEGDVLATRARPGCFVLEPKADVCLGMGSEARIARLGVESRRIDLLRGRAVVSIERIGDGAPFAVSAGELTVESSDGVVGVELDGESVIVRVLRGTAEVLAGDETSSLNSAQSAIYRGDPRALEVAPQLLEKARRDWELLATRPAGSTARASAAVPARVLPEDAVAEVAAVVAQPESEPVLEAGAGEQPTDQTSPEAPTETPPALDTAGQLAHARALVRAQQWTDAEHAYEALVRERPNDPVARNALVALGELQLQHLSRPDKALVTFDRYLASGATALDLRARYGRIVALRRLHRPLDEQRAVAQFLTLYRATPQARVLMSGADDGGAVADAGSTPEAP